MKKFLLSLGVALVSIIAYATIGPILTAVTGSAVVKMTFVDYDSPEVPAGEVAQAVAGYNKISGGTVAFSSPSFGTNKIIYLQVDLTNVKTTNNIKKVTLSAECSGSTDSKRITTWGVGYNSSAWSDALTYNNADRSITLCGDLASTETKSADTFETLSWNITDAFADGRSAVTILVYETAAMGGNFKNPAITVEEETIAEPTDLAYFVGQAVAGKAAGEDAVLDLDPAIEYTFDSPVDVGRVNLTINGGGKTISLADSVQIATQASLTINDINFNCAANTKLAPIALSANPDSSLIGANFQTEGTSLRSYAFYDTGTITLNNCNFSEVKTPLVSANNVGWNLKGLTIQNCIVQFDVASGIGQYINWYGNSRNEGSIKDIVIKNSTLYNIVENNENYFLRYQNSSNSQPQKAWAQPQFDGKCSWTMTNNTFVNLPSNKNFANNYPNKNPLCEFTWTGNVFYNTTQLLKAIQGNVVNFTAADNSIWGVTKSVDATDALKYATVDTLVFSVPTTALDFTNLDLSANFTPASGTYSANNKLGDPRWLSASEPEHEPWDFSLMFDADTIGYYKPESNIYNEWNSDPNTWGTLYDYEDPLVDEPIMINYTTEYALTKGLTFTTGAGTKQVIFRNYPLEYGGAHMYANKQIKVKVPVPAEGAKSLLLMTASTKADKIISATGVEESLGLTVYKTVGGNMSYGPMLFTLEEGATAVELTIPNAVYIQKIQFTDSVAPREATETTFAVPTIKQAVGEKFRNSLTTYSGATIYYSSSNTDVAIIDEMGTVTPIAPGITTITATIYANDSHKQAQATYELTVYDPVADQAAANSVVEIINAIGTVELTDECKALIDSALVAYDKLTDDQKSLISQEQLDVLTNAEAEYTQLSADQAAAEPVIELINAIGTVELTDECKALIDSARVAYDKLTDGQKARISQEQLDVLTNAETEYTKLSDDQAAADSVAELINAIGTVELTDECKALIDSALVAYDKLTDDQKALVSQEQLDILTNAEAEYTQLESQAVGINGVDAKGGKSGKFLQNGKIVIIRNGVEYYVNGIKK